MTGAPKKRFGQHFLCDQSVIAGIVAALDPKPSDHLVEIGPGQGALTVPVLRCGVPLDVIELDRDLILELQNRMPRKSHLTIHSSDVLQFDFDTLKTDERKLRIFGNLPYNISTPLVFHLIKFSVAIKDMLFMLQKELVDRIVASPDCHDYGRLSVMVQYHYRVQKLFSVAPDAFYPPPRVQSSMIRFIPHEQLPFVANDYEHFANLVKQAFSLRRKTLRNSLRKSVPDAVWEEVDIKSDLRAENLSVADFVLLSNVCLK